MAQIIADWEDYTIPFMAWGPGIPAGANAYDVFPTRHDPGTGRPDYNDPLQPLRNGDTGNLALSLLGLPPIPGSTMILSLPVPEPAGAALLGPAILGAMCVVRRQRLLPFLRSDVHICWRWRVGEVGGWIVGGDLVCPRAGTLRDLP